MLINGLSELKKGGQNDVFSDKKYNVIRSLPCLADPVADQTANVIKSFVF